MTRFARAKGSKASNERAPEDGTPWEVMKEQLLQAKKENEESKKRKEAEQQRIENYENFLKDRKVQKRQATWCDFPEVPNKKINITDETNKDPIKNKKNKVSNEQELPGPINNTFDDNNEAITNGAPLKKKKNKKVSKKQVSTGCVSNSSSKHENKDSSNKSKKVKDTNVTASAQNENHSVKQNQTVEHKNNNKKKNKKQVKSNANTEDSKLNNSTENNEQTDNTSFKNKSPKSKKTKKLGDGKPVRRKEINDRSFQLIINGKEIELVRFDGFPVMKKDADRLQELKTSMIKKGIPKSEVQRTIKLERRRAEKALARMKREVCYNCRKGGHVLSDCPELKSKIPGADAAEGVCFKCGSTEHRQFECKVQKDKEFRFATCFICKEPGHIARQCPDNPKGLYPNGGCCKLCGDVTHLRKDCPTVMNKKEESTVKLQTLDSSENIEDVGLQTKVTVAETSKKPKKIKF